MERRVKPGGGRLALEGPPSLGATLKTPPPRGTAPVAEPPQSAPPKRAAGGETVLLVEDEDPVREMIARLLETLGYRVWQAASAEEALRLAGAGRPGAVRPVADRRGHAGHERPRVGRGPPKPWPGLESAFSERLPGRGGAPGRERASQKGLLAKALHARGPVQKGPGSPGWAEGGDDLGGTTVMRPVACSGWCSGRNGGIPAAGRPSQVGAAEEVMDSVEAVGQGL